MKLSSLCVVLGLWLASVGQAFAQDNRQPTVLLNGGATMGSEITGPIIAMAGGAKAVVVVVVHADGPGKVAVEDWTRAEPAEVIPISVNDIPTSRELLDRATVIWFAGGSSAKLIDAIRATYLPQYIRDRWASGIIVGGDSAGAMIFPEIILTGEADLTRIIPGGTKTTTGLAILPGVLFDPHFVKRQRLNRLVSLVLDHPDRVGIGADESTAILIRGRRLEVLGASSIVVVDARTTDVPRQQTGRVSSGRDLRMHVLSHGMSLDLGTAASQP